jgi:cytoskeleton protein RodZ
MNQDTPQESLFEDPIGLRFRAARERLRWSVESVAQQLKLPVAVIDAVEREDWARLGPAIYARSYVTSYARLLGLPQGLADEAVRGRVEPDLVSSMGSLPPPRRITPRGRSRSGGRLLGVVAAVVVLVVAAWALDLPGRVRGWMAPSAPVEAAGVAPPAETITDAAPLAVPAAASGASTVATQQETGGEVLPAPATGSAVDPAPGELVLTFRGDSWVEVLGPDGVAVERGLVAAGSTRHFAPAAIGVVTLGDASMVQVSRDGAVLDAGPLDAAKRARFTVSSDGSIHPSAIH